MNNICPICERNFTCKLKYENTVCILCVREYGTKTYTGEDVRYCIDNKEGFYGEVGGGLITYNHECVIYDTPCYAFLERTLNEIFYISTTSSPVNKLIEKVKKIK